MPFGLCNVPAKFQRFIKRVLGPLIDVAVHDYFDDVFINANTPEQLIEILNSVLKLLAKAGLKCLAIKCSFSTERMHYLGRVVSKDVIYPDLDKLEKIKTWPKPDKGKGFLDFWASAINTKT